MKVTKITIGRLYNLGSYEHVRYELTAEVPEGESPSNALVGLERIISALSPKTHTYTRTALEHDARRIDEMAKALADLGPEEFYRRHGHYEGTAQDYIARCREIHAKNVADRDAWERRSAKARHLLDDLGGAAKWTDAKLDWDDNDGQP